MNIAPLINLGEIKDIIKEIWHDFKPIVFVNAYEQAVVFRGGNYLKVWNPGPRWRIPFIDTYHVENVKKDTFSVKEVTITTLDSVTISIGGEFEFYIENIVKSSVETNDWRSNLHDISQGIISSELEDIDWSEIRKKTVKNRIEKEIATRAKEMGIIADKFNFTNKSLSRAYKIYTENKKLPTDGETD